nr:ribonuclease H-like domain-containing protein [Tanacetum cinerariifolium]
MSTQQDIYAAGSESRPPMLNKENYVPWSSRLLRYAKSRPNGKLIHNSILNGPYVRRMIAEPGDSESGSENRPPMLNKENYVPWSSRLLWYAKSRPNGKLIHNSIINGSYVRRMIPEPGNPNHEVPVNETFHVQTDDELAEKELKQIEADDQAI